MREREGEREKEKEREREREGRPEGSEAQRAPKVCQTSSRVASATVFSTPVEIIESKIEKADCVFPPLLM